jgi:Ca2+-binding RTX toxin-like protein
LQAPTAAEQAAGIAATVAILGEAAKDYHVLATYASDLGVTLEGGDKSAAGMGLGLLGNSPGGAQAMPGLALSAQGTADIPGFDASAPGAVTVSDGLIILNTGSGASYSLAVPGATGSTFSLSGDGAGGTQVSAGAASDGFVFAGVNGATVSGDAQPLFFVGGSGAVSVVGGSGDTTMFGATSSTATTFLMGGSGSNFLQGGAGATTISAGTGASTLVGGTGPTLMLANGAAPALMVAGSGATTVNGTTGTGPEQIFAGSGPDRIALGSGADTMIGGTGAAHVTGGTGSDVYGFIDGHAGGQDVISGLKATDTIVFGGYGGDPIVAEGVLGGGDLITLSDGTLILLQGIDHKVFS